MSRAKRKWDHIQHALSTGQPRLTGLENVSFIHQSLPNCSVQDIDVQTKIGELTLSSPIFINAMTGGGGERTTLLNKQLATVARETRTAIAVGSQMAAIKDKNERKSFMIVRETNPNGIVIGNLGSELTVGEANEAVEMLEANALQIHLNTIQELTMPEGDRDFKYALERIGNVVQSLSIPIIVKEVGFGMSRETVRKLVEMGVKFVDVGGYGGTNFAKIENERRSRFMSFFNDWGVPTAVSIAEVKASFPSLTVLGSGGVQSSLDMVKCLSLGASAVGIAGYLLRLLTDQGETAAIEEMQATLEEITFMMTALGARTIEELQQVPIMISGDTHHWLNERGIDTKQFSNR